MKKTLDVFYIVLAVVGGLWLSVQLVFWAVLPWQPVQDFLRREVSRAAGRPVNFERISAGLTGLNLRGAEVASAAAAAEQGALLRARNVFLRWSLWQLLRGRILVKAVIVDGLDVHVIRHADGTFNFDGLFGAQDAAPEPAPEEDASFALDLNVRQLALTEGHILFTDEQMHQSAEISDLFFSVHDFGFDGEFPVSVNASLAYSGQGWPEQEAELGLTVWPDLKNLDLQAASVRLKRLVFKHEGGTFVLTGDVKNFESPAASLRLTAQHLTDALVRFAAPDAPAFTLDEADVQVKAQADLQAQQVRISALEASVNSAAVYSSGPASAPDIALPEGSVYLAASADLNHNRVQVSSFTARGLNSFISLSGPVRWAPELDFNLSGVFAADLQAAGQAVAALAVYQPRGTVSGTAQGTPSTASADIALEGVGAAVPYAGTLSDFAMRLTIKDLKRLDIPSFTGRLNGGDFEGALTLVYDGQKAVADASFHARRLALPALPETEEESAESTPSAETETEASSQAVSGFVLPPVDVKARVDIASLDAPYLWGEDILFTADLQGLTPTLEQTHGELALNTGKGEIKDLNRLTNANLLTKVMFGSLSAVSKVINSLNVFAVLNGLGSGVVSAVTNAEEKPADMVVQTVKDENGNDVQILVPYTEQKVDGRLAFELFSTDIAFRDGEAEVKKGSFVSDLMSFNLTGDMNFKTQELDLKVNAAPGRHYEDGIMPLTLTVGGTLDSPQGSMSMASSVTSLVTQGVSNNFVSRSVKKGLGGIFGLFKKKDKEEPAAPAEKSAAAAAKDISVSSSAPSAALP